MLAGLDCILLCRQAEGVESHGVQHVETLQSLVACKDVTCDIAKGVPYMKARAARVREHVQYIILRFSFRYFGLVSMLLLPASLPLFLYFLK